MTVKLSDWGSFLYRFTPRALVTGTCTLLFLSTKIMSRVDISNNHMSSLMHCSLCLLFALAWVTQKTHTNKLELDCD